MKYTPSTLSSWAKAIHKALNAAHVDGTRLFEQAGLDIATLRDPQGRYPVAAVNRLWELAAAATGDPAFGLAVARHTGTTTFHALGYSLQASTTLKEAFERMVRYLGVVINGTRPQFSLCDGLYRYQIAGPGSDIQLAAEAVDAFAYVTVRMCRGLWGPQFVPNHVRLCRPTPADTAPYAAAFRAPIEFAADENAIYFDAGALESPLEGAHPELARQNDEVAAQYLAQFENPGVQTRVRGILLEQLTHGEPSQEKVATALQMSARSLQRRLSEEGLTYKMLLDQTRRELALAYIADARYALNEITYLLGFSDASSFTHAFQRWTGQSPSAYRKNGFS